MKLSLILCVFGGMLVYTPAIMALMSGVRSEEDIIQWLMHQPIEMLESFKAMQTSGYAFAVFGFGLSYSTFNPVF